LGAVDIGSGDLNWQFQDADAPLVPAFVDSDVVATRSLDGPVFALDPADGSVVSEVPLGAGSGLGVDDAGRWFAPLSEGEVVAGQGGESGLWRTAIEGVPVQPAVADGRVYVSTIEMSPEELNLAFPDEMIEGIDSPGRLYALDAEDGEILWESERVGAGIGAPAVRNGRVYWAGGDGDILVHNAESGRREWEYKTNGSFHTTPAVTDSIVFAGNDDGTLYMLDPDTGEQLAGPSTGASIRGGPIIVDDIVYWGDQAGTVVATDLNGDGDDWTFEVEGPVRAMTVGHGRVVVGTDWAYWVVGEGDGSGETTADGGSDTTTSTDGSGAGGNDFESTGTADRKRGLFSNGGDEPEFISDGLNLTVLGFLLSVAGILHQMTQGR
jgi:outer membrane protein assembly factor BamB